MATTLRESKLECNVRFIVERSPLFLAFPATLHLFEHDYGDIYPFWHGALMVPGDMFLFQDFLNKHPDQRIFACVELSDGRHGSGIVVALRELFDGTDAPTFLVAVSSDTKLTTESNDILDELSSPE